MEKREYWALAWGAVIMSLTGVLLWFDDFFVTPEKPACSSARRA